MVSGSQIHPYWHQEISLKVNVQYLQFQQWLGLIFHINDLLYRKYDLIYQRYYYILLYELLTEGVTYVEKVMDSIELVENKPEWLKLIHCFLNEIRASIADEEFNFVEYKRHNSSHMFQNSYELLQGNGKIKRQRKNNDLLQLKSQISGVLEKRGNDYVFDKYLTSKLYPLFHKLHNDLRNLQNQEVARKLAEVEEEKSFGDRRF